MPDRKHLPHCYGDRRLYCDCPDFRILFWAAFKIWVKAALTKVESVKGDK